MHEAGANLTAALRLGHNVLPPLHLPPFTQNRKEIGEPRTPTNTRRRVRGGADGHGSHLAQRFPSKSKSLSQRFVRELFGGGGGALSALRVFLPLLLLLPHPQDLELVPRDQLGIDDVQVLRSPQVDVGELRQAAPQLGAEYLEALRAAAPGRLLGKGQ